MCACWLLPGAVCVQEKTVMRQVAIPREVYTGSCNQLFDFFAQHLVTFVAEQSKVCLSP